MVKNLPAKQEIQVLSLGRENPLEEGMVTHSSILAWRIPQTDEPAGLQSMGSQRVRQDQVTNASLHHWTAREAQLLNVLQNLNTEKGKKYL